MTRSVLVYDADCGFCTRSARWLQASGRDRFDVVPWQQLDLEARGLTAGQVISCAHWLEDGRPTAAGSDAIGSALMRTRWPFVGRVIRSRRHRPLSRWVYGIVARNRHQMPGATGTCKRPRACAPPRPSRAAPPPTAASGSILPPAKSHTQRRAAALPHISQVPFVDEHATTIAAGVDDVWDDLLDTLDRAFCRAWTVRYARLVGCADTTAVGPRPLTVGSTLPGFRVIEALPPSQLVLECRHRFTTGVLIFRLEPLGPNRTHLTAETRAAFPGITGRVYRLLVIGSRGHVVAVRRLLATIERESTPFA